MAGRDDRHVTGKFTRERDVIAVCGDGTPCAAEKRDIRGDDERAPERPAGAVHREAESGEIAGDRALDVDAPAHGPQVAGDRRAHAYRTGKKELVAHNRRGGDDRAAENREISRDRSGAHDRDAREISVPG